MVSRRRNTFKNIISSNELSGCAFSCMSSSPVWLTANSDCCDLNSLYSTLEISSVIAISGILVVGST